jgi:hypothetical protein
MSSAVHPEGHPHCVTENAAGVMVEMGGKEETAVRTSVRPCSLAALPPIGALSEAVSMGGQEDTTIRQQSRSVTPPKNGSSG